MFDEVFRDFSYMLELSKSYVSVESARSSVEINLRCFTERIDTLLDKLIEYIKKSLEFDNEEKFNNIVKDKEKNISNYMKSPPYKLNSYLQGRLTLKSYIIIFINYRYYSIEERAEAIKNVSFEGYKQFRA